MSLPLNEIEQQALSLLPEEREVLIQRLVQSLDNAAINDVDEAWIREAEKRYQAYKEGITKGISGDNIFSEIRRELGW